MVAGVHSDVSPSALMISLAAPAVVAKRCSSPATRPVKSRVTLPRQLRQTISMFTDVVIYKRKQSLKGSFEKDFRLGDFGIDRWLRCFANDRDVSNEIIRMNLRPPLRGLGDGYEITVG